MRPVRLFFIAVQFLTRIPVPRDLATTEREIGQASAFFPLVGVIVGGTAALLHTALLKVLPPSTCVLLVLIYTALVTNAFHEDGLADAFDGFGGGWTGERVLEIMRDSRIGTFGALALVFLVLAKYNFVSALEPARVWRWLIVAHTAARWTALPLCLWLTYARSEGQGKPVAQHVGWLQMVIATLTLSAVLILLTPGAAVAAVLVTVSLFVGTGFYYRWRIHGITGDCLGATNQLAEVAIYLTAVILAGWSTEQ